MEMYQFCFFHCTHDLLISVPLSVTVYTLSAFPFDFPCSAISNCSTLTVFLNLRIISKAVIFRKIDVDVYNGSLPLRSNIALTTSTSCLCSLFKKNWMLYLVFGLFFFFPLAILSPPYISIPYSSYTITTLSQLSSLCPLTCMYTTIYITRVLPIYL